MLIWRMEREDWDTEKKAEIKRGYGKFTKAFVAYVA